MNLHAVFDRDTAGTIVTKPLVGFNTELKNGMIVLVRLEYTDTLAHLGAIMMGAKKVDSVQLTLKPHQAKEVAQRLNYLADLILSNSTPDAENL